MSLRWPLPALLAWAVAWGLFMGLRAAGMPVLLAMVGGTLLGVAGSVWGGSWWRRAVVAFGFPLSLALSGSLAVPAWAWLLPLALLLLVYPINAWRDAPLFPTPEGALDHLPDLAPLPPGARVLDAGCGLGQGLHAAAVGVHRVAGALQQVFQVVALLQRGADHPDQLTLAGARRGEQSGQGGINQIGACFQASHRDRRDG